MSPTDIDPQVEKDTDPRHFIRIFFEEFLERYHGPPDITCLLQSLITYIEGDRCSKRVLPDLKRLKDKRCREALELRAKADDDVSLFSFTIAAKNF